ncbi:MAG: hypothetical protein PHC61_04215 [Chitinivibrionales bacterium]|nr:hypothetical protein [Chitinivibrionales bacterium]
MKNLFIILLLINIFGCDSPKKKILQEKGFGTMQERIIPDVIQQKNGVVSVLSINEPNSFVVINGKMEIELVTINTLESITSKLIHSGFPGDKYFSDPEHGFIWAIMGRGFYALDIKTKQYGYVVVSYDGDSKVDNTFLIDSGKKTFFVGCWYVMDEGKSYAEYDLFDLVKNEIGFTSQKYKGYSLPYSEDSFLLEKFLGGPKIEWAICDFKSQKETKNALTNKLTDLNFKINLFFKPYNLNKRMLLGFNNDTTPTKFLSARWDSGLEDIKVEPFTIQIPEKYFLSKCFNISPDGNWAKTTANHEDSKQEELIFYNIKDKYPQGLSLPIFGGYTGLETPGAFVNHSTLGPLYVEMDYDHPNVLFIYKLNDGLKLLQSGVAKTAGK